MDKTMIKILIGDDSILARRQLRDILSDNGYYNIIEATNGQEAVDLYKEHSPDLTFIDIVMPVKDGITATHEIYQWNNNANVVIASSLGTQTQLKRAITEGAREFIQKPFQPQQIAKIAASILEENK